MSAFFVGNVRVSSAIAEMGSRLARMPATPIDRAIAAMVIFLSLFLNREVAHPEDGFKADQVFVIICRIIAADNGFDEFLSW